jgi:hypothetical protein
MSPNKLKEKVCFMYIEIVKGQWKPVIYTESDGNLVLFEI